MTISNDLSSQEHIKELKKEIKRLQKLIHHDSLTGVLNRKGFIVHVTPFLEEAIFAQRKVEKRTSLRIKSFSVLFIDIDNFKEINDTFGHQAGDETLKKVVDVINKSIRHSDFVCRWGGEEIVIALLGPNEMSARYVAEKILKAVEKKVVLETSPGDRKVTVSIGVAGISRSIELLEDIVDRADKAMYVAKGERGKNNVVCFSEIK
jgi:diguanylate cyclase (GGDEF)-like protein